MGKCVALVRLRCSIHLRLRTYKVMWVFDEPCCGTCYTVYCTCIHTYIYIHISSHLCLNHVMPMLFPCHAMPCHLHQLGWTGNRQTPRLRLNLARKRGAHGWTVEITQVHGSVSRSLPQRAALDAGLREGGLPSARTVWSMEHGVWSRLFSLAGQTKASDSTAFMLPCRQNRLDMSPPSSVRSKVCKVYETW